MLLKNVDLEGKLNHGRQLVNGSRGIVVSFTPKRQVMDRLRKESAALRGRQGANATEADKRRERALFTNRSRLETAATADYLLFL